VDAWKRTYRAVWLANLVTAAGMMSFLPFFPSHLERLGVEGEDALALWTGVIFGAAPLSAAFMSPIWGALGDRIGRRMMVLRSMFAITLFVGAMAFVRDPWTLLALRLAQGVFSGFVAPSLTLVSIGAPPDRQGRIAGSLQVAMGLGAVAGPLLGEIVREAAGIPAVYLCVALLSGLSGLLVLAAASEDHEKRQHHAGALGVRSLLSASLGDLHELRSNRGLRGAVVIVFWLYFGTGATQPQLELFVRDLDSHFAWVPASTAALFSLPAAINLLAMPAWGRTGDARGHSRALALCTAITGALLVANAFVVGYEDLLVVRISLGAAMAGAGPLAFGVAAAQTPDERGAFGVVFSARALAISASAMAGGGLAAWVGVRGLFALGGVSILSALFWTSRSRDLRRASIDRDRGARI
jgi:DHA1 family multidrug resistance protein-like MFS transporter